MEQVGASAPPGSLALDDQHAKPKSLVVLNHRFVEICAERLGDLWDWQRWRIAVMAVV